jgi:hypothetical protein
MQIKRFEAQDMTHAFRLIKKQFGPQAVILSARTLKKETGMFGFKKTQRRSDSSDRFLPDPIETGRLFRRFIGNAWGANPILRSSPFK